MSSAAYYLQLFLLVSGYSGNGFSCVDINECAVNNGGCSLAPRVECVNTPGSRTCGPCPAGNIFLIFDRLCLLKIYYIPSKEIVAFLD